MELASLYRQNSSVTPGLHPSRMAANFYSNRGNGVGGSSAGLGGSFEHGGGPQNQLPDPTLSVKVDQMMTMLSSTQQLLVSQQATCSRLEDTVSKLSSDVAAIQQELASGQSAVKTGTKAGSRRKLPRELSTAVKRVHAAADEEQQFNGSELYKSKHNQDVADFLCTQLKSEYDDKYQLNEIKGAIHRYFESRRRKHNDSQPRRQHVVSENQKNTQRKAYQRRLFDRRMKYVKNEDESKKLTEIDETYMTEESSSESENVVKRHQLTWRSDELNKLVKRLDKRAEKEEKKTPSNARTALKKRVDSTPSLIGPPEDAPAWTVAGSSSINTTPSATIPNESPLTTPDQNSGTPEAPPRTGPVNPRRLVRREAFKDYYQSDSSSLESELD